MVDRILETGGASVLEIKVYEKYIQTSFDIKLVYLTRSPQSVV